MDTRTHEVLDGLRAVDTLTPSERADLAAAEAMIASTLAALPSPALPDLSVDVMRRIALSGRVYGTPHGAAPGVAAAAAGMAHGAPATLQANAHAAGAQTPFARLLGWLLAPRPVALMWRPAYAFAGVVAVAGLVAIGAIAQGGSSARSSQVFTQFTLNAPDAERVQLAGDFTNWKPEYTMRKSAPGVWTIVVPLEPGVHSYSFVVDEEQWIADPSAPSVDDGFGGTNSRLAVLSPDEAVL